MVNDGDTESEEDTEMEEEEEKKLIRDEQMEMRATVCGMKRKIGSILTKAYRSRNGRGVTGLFQTGIRLSCRSSF